MNKAPMIEKASDSQPTHIEIAVPKNPNRPQQPKEHMTREEIANTMLWARKDDIDQSRSPLNSNFQLQTKSMNQNEKSELFHQIVGSAEREQAEEADPSIVPVTTDMIEKQRMDQAEQIDGQVMDLEDMQFKPEDLKNFTNRNNKK